LIITAWRITKRKHKEVAFTGEGAEESGGRWNSEGTRIVYASSSISLAILEILVNLQDDKILSTYDVIGSFSFKKGAVVIIPSQDWLSHLAL